MSGGMNPSLSFFADFFGRQFMDAVCQKIYEC